VDSRADLAAATNHVLRSLGRPAIDPATVFSFVGDGARALVARALGPVDPALIDEGVARFLDYYGGHLLDATRPYPGIDAVVAALATRGVALSVLTNKPAALTLRILDGLGLRQWFRGVVGGDSLPTRKPDPTGLLWLLAESGTRPEAALLVGDSPVDLETARAAGTAFCGVAWGLCPERLRAARPAIVIDRAEALLPLVEGRRGSTPRGGVGSIRGS
jgi:phosphoglycolate phosphatase